MTTVYLDSHHISRIASGSSTLKDAFGPEDDLCFSHSHIVEALPKEPTNIESSIARLRLITDSTATGLIPWSHVLKLEAFNNGKLSLRDIVCPISEILFYGLDTTEFGSRSHWLKKARTSLNKRLADIPDANQRRSMRAKLFKHGKFTPFASRLLRQQQATFIDSNSNALPELALPEFRPLFEEGGMYDFLSGNISEQKFHETFMKTAGNPIVLANLIAYPELAIMDV